MKGERARTFVAQVKNGQYDAIQYDGVEDTLVREIHETVVRLIESSGFGKRAAEARMTDGILPPLNPLGPGEDRSERIERIAVARLYAKTEMTLVKLAAGYLEEFGNVSLRIDTHTLIFEPRE